MPSPLGAATEALENPAVRINGEVYKQVGASVVYPTPQNRKRTYFTRQLDTAVARALRTVRLNAMCCSDLCVWSRPGSNR